MEGVRKLRERKSTVNRAEGFREQRVGMSKERRENKLRIDRAMRAFREPKERDRACEGKSEQETKARAREKE
eukprot:2084213-Pleurochrysis_carterae.AAC.1